jgi:hypothetical protein
MNLQDITGYRTNEDYTETLAYFVDGRGFVTHCAHNDRRVCRPCFEADQRLYRNCDGRVVRVG